MRTRNPAIRRLLKYQSGTVENAATYSGVVFKTLYFAALTFVAALFSFLFAESLAGSPLLIGLVIGVPIAAFVLAIVATLAPSTTPVTGTLYAVLQGALLGFISALFDAAYKGVVFSALLSTCGVLLVMLVLYSTGVIRVGNMFRRVMMSALIGALFVNLVMFILSLISPQAGALLYGNGPLAVGISILMVLIASFTILIDLDNITYVVSSGLDKKWEWYASFSLLVTLIWLYAEFLRLFARLSSRD